MIDEKKELLHKITKQRYLEFFKDKGAVYMEASGNEEAHYIGIAQEFFGELNSLFDFMTVNLLKHYAATKEYDKEFLIEPLLNIGKDNYIEALTDEFIGVLSPNQIISVFYDLCQAEAICTGFLERCGQAGVIYKLLSRLKAEI